MPFANDKQRKYLYANKPEVAKKFAKDTSASDALIKKLTKKN